MGALASADKSGLVREWTWHRSRGAIARLRAELNETGDTLLAPTLGRRAFFRVMTDLSRAPFGEIIGGDLSLFRWVDNESVGHIRGFDICVILCLFGADCRGDRAGLLFDIVAAAERERARGKLARRKEDLATWPMVADRIQEGAISSAIVNSAPCMIGAGIWRRWPTASESFSVVASMRRFLGTASARDRVNPLLHGARTIQRDQFAAWLSSLVTVIEACKPFAVPNLASSLTSGADDDGIGLASLAKEKASIAGQAQAFGRSAATRYRVPPLSGAAAAAKASSPVSDRRHREHVLKMKVRRATSLAELQAAAKRTGFAVSDVLRIKAVFQTSIDESGMLGIKQFRAIMARVFPKLASEGSIDVLFREFDVDSNGRCDFHELVQGLAALAHGSTSEKLDIMFEVFDLNADGQLTVPEILRFVKRSTDRQFAAATRAVEAIAETPSEVDGEFSLGELISLALANPEVLRVMTNAIDVPFATATAEAAAGVTGAAARLDDAQAALQALVKAVKALQGSRPQQVTFEAMFKFVSNALQQAAEQRREDRRASRVAASAAGLSPLADAQVAPLTNVADARCTDESGSFVSPPAEWMVHPMAAFNRLRFEGFLRFCFFPDTIAPASDGGQLKLPGGLASDVCNVLDAVSRITAVAPEALSPFKCLACGLASSSEQKAAAFFRGLDHSASNRCAKADLTRAVLAQQGRDDELIAVAGRIVQMMDIDGDGTVSRAEFIEGCSRHPTLFKCMTMLLGGEDMLEATTKPSARKSSRAKNKDEPKVSDRGAGNPKTTAASSEAAAGGDTAASASSKLGSMLRSALDGESHTATKRVATTADFEGIPMFLTSPATRGGAYRHTSHRLVGRRPGMQTRVAAANAAAARAKMLVKRDRDAMKHVSISLGRMIETLERGQ